MRTFTDKDIQALTAAFQIYMKNLDGKVRKKSTLIPLMEKSLKCGISIDEIFNRENYYRSRTTTATDYIDYLCVSKNVKTIKQEDNWCDEITFMQLLSQVFHDFYTVVCPKSGTWNTEKSRINLEKTIKKYSFEAILSEKLIGEVLAYHDREDVTCFQFLESILNESENFDIIIEPSLERKDRLQAIEDRKESEVDSENIDTVEYQEAIDSNHYIENVQELTDMYPTIDINTYQENDDTDIYETISESESQSETTLIIRDPNEYKKQCLYTSVMYLTLEECNELAKAMPEHSSMTLRGFVEALACGNIDKDKESLTARNAHMTLASDLIPLFIETIQYQGIDIDDNELKEHDALLEDWDLRNPNTRKRQKLTQLILKYGNKDIDLLTALNDIEDLYPLHTN